MFENVHSSFMGRATSFRVLCKSCAAQCPCIPPNILMPKTTTVKSWFSVLEKIPVSLRTGTFTILPRIVQKYKYLVFMYFRSFPDIVETNVLIFMNVFFFCNSPHVQNMINGQMIVLRIQNDRFFWKDLKNNGFVFFIKEK